MAGMSAPSDLSRSRPPAPPRRQVVLVRVLLVALVLTAVLVLAVTLRASGSLTSVRSAADLGVELLFDLWNLAPLAGMAVLVLLIRRRLPDALVVVGCGVLVLVGLTVWALVDFLGSESSTSALVFLVLPLYQWAVVVLTGLVAWAVHAVRQRRLRAQRST